MNRRWYFAILVLAVAGNALAGMVFLPAEAAFQVQDLTRANKRVTVTWAVAPGYYLYQERITLRRPTGQVMLPLNGKLQAGTAAFREDLEPGFQRLLKDQVQLSWPDAGGPLKLTYQGCAEAGLCYPPQVLEIP